MTRVAARVLLASLVSGLAACVGAAPEGGVGDDDDDDVGIEADAGGGGGSDAGPVAASCQDSAQVPLGAARPVDIMAASDLAAVIARMPCVVDPWLVGILESADTMWYDKRSIIPGYQDSFGDNSVLPTGMRPNTIDSQLINLAVPGGHAQIFSERGVFHFPFGRPGGFGDDGAVVDFWNVPRSGGALLPVVWWMREPTGYTHRIEWLFPVGTTLGEVLFIVDTDGDGTWYPFEIRTRTRALDGWTVDVFQPFPTAAALAAALEAKRPERPEWAAAADIDALLAHLRDDGTLESANLGASHFASAFTTMNGALDVLPPLADATILKELLLGTPFVSARGAVWKESGALRTYAATAEAGFSIVPRGYNAGFLSVDDETCSRCHRDAARPFRDWYSNIIAYGELWGGDEAFSWHPFENDTFVDDSGDVVHFNDDNRTFRPDFESTGLLAPYDESDHPATVYEQIQREWTNYEY